MSGLEQGLVPTDIPDPADTSGKVMPPEPTTNPGGDARSPGIAPPPPKDPAETYPMNGKSDCTADQLLLQIKDDLLQKTDENVQIETARLLNIITQLSQSDLVLKYRHLQIAIMALSCDPPKVALAQSIRSDLERHMQRKGEGLSKFVIKFGGVSPLGAVMLGIVASIMSLYIFVGIFVPAIVSNPSSLITTMFKVAAKSSEEGLHPLLILMGASFVGSIISILNRLDFFASLTVYDPFLVFVTTATKPVIAVAFGVVVFALLNTGFFSSEISLGSSGKSYLALALGFFCGFSERFAKDIVARAENQFAPGQPAKSGS